MTSKEIRTRAYQDLKKQGVKRITKRLKELIEEHISDVKNFNNIISQINEDKVYPYQTFIDLREYGYKFCEVMYDPNRETGTANVMFGLVYSFDFIPRPLNIDFIDKGILEPKIVQLPKATKKYRFKISIPDHLINA